MYLEIQVQKNKEERKSMKNKFLKNLIIILIIIVLCVGLVLCVPQIFNFIKIKIEISNTLKGIDNLYELKNDTLLNSMKQYNEELANGKQEAFFTSDIYENPKFLLKDYNVYNDELLGKIYIPKVNITLPLFNGAKEENMLKGAVCWGNTSLPIGGENTNTVISAHNIYYGNEMFFKIYNLEIGDDIYIENFWEELHYKVCNFVITENDDFSYSYIENGRSLITLTTCYNYPENNKRYIVVAEQVKN